MGTIGYMVMAISYMVMAIWPLLHGYWLRVLVID